MVDPTSIDPEKGYAPDFNFAALLDLPQHVQIKKIIDILGLVNNHAFYAAIGSYYIKLHDILDDWNTARGEIREERDE